MVANETAPRFLVRRDASAENWMVWDRLTKRPAMLKGQDLVSLALSAAENLRDTLNADNHAEPAQKTVRKRAGMLLFEQTDAARESSVCPIKDDTLPELPGLCAGPFR
jgi:hypothetical protein